MAFKAVIKASVPIAEIRELKHGLVFNDTKSFMVPKFSVCKTDAARLVRSDTIWFTRLAPSETSDDVIPAMVPTNAAKAASKAARPSPAAIVISVAEFANGPAIPLQIPVEILANSLVKPPVIVSNTAVTPAHGREGFNWHKLLVTFIPAATVPSKLGKDMAPSKGPFGTVGKILASVDAGNTTLTPERKSVCAWNGANAPVENPVHPF